MTAKEYLSQAFWLDKQIESKLEYASMLRESATRVTSRYTAEPFGGTEKQSNIENALTKLIDLDKEINFEVDKLVDLKSEIGELIGQIASNKHRILLEYRYLQNKAWETIAERMEFDLRWVHRLHGQALIEMTRIMKQNNIYINSPLEATVIHKVM